MFANAHLAAVNFAFPDVCNVPTPVGPIPTPFPNTAMSVTHIPTVLNVMLSAMPAQNLLTMAPVTMGDQPGVGLGLVSGMVMGPCRYLMGSTKVMFGAGPVTRMTSMTGHNGASPNAVGVTISPAQTKVMVLS